MPGPTRNRPIPDDAETILKPAQPPRTLRSTPSSSGPKAKAAPPPTPPPQPGKYVEDVERFYARASLMLMPFAPKACSTMVEEITVTANPDEIPKMRLTHCAEAWDKLAEKNPAVRRMLDKYTQRSPFVDVIELNAPIMGALAAEMGLFSQVGKLIGKLFSRRTEPEPQPMQTYDEQGHYQNTEFRPVA